MGAALLIAASAADGCPMGALDHAQPHGTYLCFLPVSSLRRRTPGPPPFSSMNSTPGQIGAEGPSGHMPHLSLFLGRLGGSDARIIMGDDEAALRLWREKRGEVEPEDLSGNLIVQLGVVTEPLNRHWFERDTGQAVKEVQCRIGRLVNRRTGRAHKSGKVAGCHG